MLAADFISGSHWYLDHLPEQIGPTARVVITMLVEEREVTGLLDTGASHCVLAWDVASRLGPISLTGEPEIRGLGGSVHHGRLFPVNVTFVAHQGNR